MENKNNLQQDQKQTAEITAEEMKEILVGKNFEENKKKLLKIPFGEQWEVIKNLCMLLCEKENEVTEENCYEIADMINCMISIIEEIDKGGLLCQIVYQEINQSMFLLAVVSLARTEKYLQLNNRYLEGIISINVA